MFHGKKKIKFLLQNNKALGTGLHVKENPASTQLAMSFSHPLTAYPTNQYQVRDMKTGNIPCYQIIAKGCI